MLTLKYYSTNRKAPVVSFGEALLNGQAPDRGLYMPLQVPKIKPDILSSLSAMSYPEVAFTVLNEFLRGEIPESVLHAMTSEAYNYPVPLELVFERKFVMRLDQGPTASFKDFAARMMGKLMSYYLAQTHCRLLILTATSGDTGSAIANAFYELDNIDVVVLFPRLEVTSRQRKQMTTLGKNIRVIEVDGKFDDCQALVKRAFADPELAYLNLSSANSINIGRLIPQAVYYVYAWAQLRTSVADKPVFVVPSGNFGDMMGGIIAWRMGLPVKRMVIAVNENDEFQQFLETGKYQKIEPSVNCISSAMNVGHPSNLARLVDLYGGEMDERGNLNRHPDINQMRHDMFAVSISDSRTRDTIHDAWKEHKLLLEPHGAVGWAGFQHYISSIGNDPEQLFVVLETANPAKFPEQINEILQFDPLLPASLQGLEEKDEHYDHITNDYDTFRNYLLSR